MSVTFKPKNSKKVARTDWSYDDGGFDANVDGQHWLAAVHKLLGLPIVEKWDCIPWSATAEECRAWAARLDEAFKTLRLFTQPRTPDDAFVPAYLAAWRDFLATCSGYKVLP